jgi:hypothetical protein
MTTSGGRMPPHGTPGHPSRLPKLALPLLRSPIRRPVRSHRRPPHSGWRRPFSRPPEASNPPTVAGGEVSTRLWRMDVSRRRPSLRDLLTRHPLAGCGATPVSTLCTLAYGPAATRRAAPSEASTTIPVPPLRRPAHRRRVGLPVHRPAQPRAPELDRSGGRGARPALGGHQNGIAAESR